MLVRQLWKDLRLRRICDIEASEPPYGIAILSRFKSRVGPERLMRIVDHARVEVLVKKRRIKGETLAFDSTFIKVHSAHENDLLHRLLRRFISECAHVVDLSKLRTLSSTSDKMVMENAGN